MKKHKIIGYILFIILSSSKCKEEALPLPKPNPWYVQPALDTIWTSPNGFSITPVFTTNNDVLMSEEYTDPRGEVFKLFDANTGKLKWQWADYLRVEDYFGGNNHTVVNNTKVLASGNNTYAFNMLTGQTLWKHRMNSDSMSGSNNIFTDDDGYIYHGFNSKTQRNTYCIYRTKYDEANWELICTYKDSLNVDRVFSNSIAFSKNNSGEEIMVFTLYMDFTTNGKLDSKTKICGYNLENNIFDWIKDYSYKYVEFKNCKMASNLGKVFTFSTYSTNNFFVAFNVNDGTISWEKKLPNFGVSMHLYKDNIVVLSNNSSSVYCLNQNTGAVVWETPFVYHNDMNYPNINFAFDDANVFKNYLFSTQCSNLLVLNLDNGSIVFNKPVSLPGGCLQYGIAINENKRCFYVQDRNKAVCYKLPEVVKY